MNTEATITTSEAANGQDTGEAANNKPHADEYFFSYALELNDLIKRHKAKPDFRTNAAVLKHLDKHVELVKAALCEGYDDDAECGNEPADGAWMQVRGTYDYCGFRTVRVELENVTGDSLDTVNRTGIFLDDPLLEQVQRAIERICSGVREMHMRSETTTTFYREVLINGGDENEKSEARRKAAKESESVSVVFDLIIAQIDTILNNLTI